HLLHTRDSDRVGCVGADSNNVVRHAAIALYVYIHTYRHRERAGPGCGLDDEGRKLIQSGQTKESRLERWVMADGWAKKTPLRLPPTGKVLPTCSRVVHHQRIPLVVLKWDVMYSNCPPISTHPDQRRRLTAPAVTIGCPTTRRRHP